MNLKLPHKQLPDALMIASETADTTAAVSRHSAAEASAVSLCLWRGCVPWPSAEGTRSIGVSYRDTAEAGSFTFWTPSVNIRGRFRGWRRRWPIQIRFRR